MTLSGSAFPMPLGQTRSLQPHHDHTDSTESRTVFWLPLGALTNLFWAEMEISQFYSEWFYIPSQVPLFLHTRGYESADRSPVPKTDRAGSGEADSSTAAVTKRVMIWLTLIVVVPMQRERGWSDGCSNMRTGFCGCSPQLYLYIWPELSTSSGFACLFLTCILFSVCHGVYLDKAMSSSVLKLIWVVVVLFPPEAVFLLAFFPGQKHLDISSPLQGCCECLPQVWLGLPDVPLPLASSVGCAKITALNQLFGASVYKGHYFCFVMSPVLGIYWSTGVGGSQGSHHIGRNPIIFMDAFCKACQAQQNLALNLLLLWFYLSSWIKAILKAGYLVQMHAIKHIYSSDLVAAWWKKACDKNILQEYHAVDLKSVKTKGWVLSLICGKWGGLHHCIGKQGLTGVERLRSGKFRTGSTGNNAWFWYP